MVKSTTESEVLKKSLDYGFQLIGNFKGSNELSKWLCLDCGYVFDRKWRVMNSNGSRTCKSCVTIKRDEDRFEKLNLSCKKLDCLLLEDMTYEPRVEMKFKRDALLKVSFKCGHTEKRLCETIHTKMKGNCSKCKKSNKWTPTLISEHLRSMNIICEPSSVTKYGKDGHWRVNNFIYACGHKGDSSIFNSIKSTSGLCAVCSHTLKSNRLNPKQMFIKTKELEEIFGTGNVFLYYNSDVSETKYTQSRALCGHVKCTTCNDWFDARVTQLTGENPRYKCEKCSKKESSGETEIRTLLKSWGVNFSTQHKFMNLTSEKGSLLKFDFAIRNQQEEVIMLIEFDGQQHYKVIEGWGGELKFAEITINDSKKDEYCLENNLKLIRIPYWNQYAIESILFSELVDCGVLMEE